VPAGAVRIGTRGSALALWQASWVAERLRRELPDRDTELVTVTTRGDVHTGPFTGAPGEIGFFTTGIEAALLEGRIGVAVHSLKDLPASEEDRLPVVAVPLRDDPADVLVSRTGQRLDALAAGARVGTSSPRRTCLILARRPDLLVEPIRGNVDTRVSKVRAGEFDATVLAAAGLARLGMADVVVERFDPVDFPPAPGQGALAVQVREDDAELLAAVRRIDDPRARATAGAERICLEALGGGCARPIGAHARFEGGRMVLTAVVGTPDGSKLVRAERSGTTPDDLGRAVAEDLLGLGADRLRG
jgi:hydroxymethylbilane synthase